MLVAERRFRSVVSIQHSMTKLHRGLRSSLCFLQSYKMLTINAERDLEELCSWLSGTTVTSPSDLGMLGMENSAKIVTHSVMDYGANKALGLLCD